MCFICLLFGFRLQMAAGKQAKSVGLESDLPGAQGPGRQARRRHDL